MRRFRLKWLVTMLICLTCVCSVSKVVRAEDYSYLVDTIPTLADYPDFPSLDKNKKTCFTWYPSIYIPDEEVAICYEVELAKNKQFTDAQKFETSETSLELNRSQFGKNGGCHYVRVRIRIDTLDSEVLYSEWSEVKEYVYVAINKTNFPGMYKVLKNGGKASTLTGVKKITYDTNKDGWLDPKEIFGITKLSTANTSKKKNGKYYIVKATNVSSLKGIEYLSNVSSISLDRYSGNKIDLSKNNVTFVDICGVTAKQITIVAPDALDVSIQADESAKVNKIDLSKCNKAVHVLAYGNNGTKTLKLPKTKKKMKILSLSEFNFKTLNMNSYTNLQQLYVYHSDIKKVNVNKCKNLRYIYFYYCDKIKSLNLASNKKLRGADFYMTPGLTQTTVKRPKNGKVTWGKGKWWYDTKQYQNDMKKLY